MSFTKGVQQGELCYSFRKNDADDDEHSSVDSSDDDCDEEVEEDGLFSAPKKRPSVLGRLFPSLSMHSKTKSTRNNKNSTLPDKGSSGSDKAKKLPNFSWRQIRRQLGMFRLLVVPYFAESSKARFMILAILALTIVNSGMNITLSYASRYFWNALAKRDTDAFVQIFALYVSLMVINSPIDSYYSFLTDQLKIHWRDWMSKRTLGLYLSDCVYFKLSDDIDNPDQRLSEDISSFTDYSLHFAILVLSNTIGFSSFSVVLWNIYPPLVFAVFVYALFGTMITTLLGRILIPLNYTQLRSEANLRYSMVRLRDNAEAVAFYKGEALEGNHVTSKIDDVVENQQKLNIASLNLGFFTNFYHHLTAVLPIAVIAHKYFAGEVEIGVISQSVGAFSAILGNLSIIINNFKSLSYFSAGMERLIGLYEAMRLVDSNRDDNSPILGVSNATDGVPRPRENLAAGAEPLDSSKSPNSIHSSRSLGSTKSIQVQSTISLQKWPHEPRANVLMSIDKLQLFTPDYRRILASDLSLTLHTKDRLLISGDSGCGKSGLLRALAGLWTAGTGSIVRTSDTFFLPQRPYCVTGTLRDQILYPKPEKKYADRELLQILAQVNMLDLAERCGDGDMYAGLSVVLDWGNILSLGEQQRLSFGRLLVHRPQLVILDESTSALDVESEARMYGLLQSVPAYVSVGHRTTLERFHTKRLRLSAEDVNHEVTSICIVGEENSRASAPPRRTNVIPDKKHLPPRGPHT